MGWEGKREGSKEGEEREGRTRISGAKIRL